MLNKHQYILFRYYGIHLFALIAIIIVGYSTRYYSYIYPSAIQLYGGDILWATMFYYIFKLILGDIQPKYLLLITAAFALSIEISQLYSPEWLMICRKTFIGKMLLGEGFLWSDLLCYTIGIILAWLIDKLWLRIYVQKNS